MVSAKADGKFCCNEYGETVVCPVLEAEYRTIARLSELERRICISISGKCINYLREELHGPVVF